MLGVLERVGVDVVGASPLNLSQWPHLLQVLIIFFFFLGIDNLCGRMVVIMRVTTKIIASIFWNAFFVSSPVLNILCALSHLILKENLWSRYSLYPCLRSEDPEAQQVHELTPSSVSRVRIQTQVCLKWRSVLSASVLMMLYIYIYFFLYQFFKVHF